MRQHHHPVTGKVHVRLQPVRARFHGGAHGFEAVFWAHGLEAPVGYRLREGGARLGV